MMKTYESCGIHDIFTMKHMTVFQLMSEMKELNKN